MNNLTGFAELLWQTDIKNLNFGFSLEKCNLIYSFGNSWVYDNIICFNICLTDSKIYVSI